MEEPFDKDDEPAGASGTNSEDDWMSANSDSEEADEDPNPTGIGEDDLIDSAEEDSCSSSSSASNSDSSSNDKHAKKHKQKKIVQSKKQVKQKPKKNVKKGKEGKAAE